MSKSIGGVAAIGPQVAFIFSGKAVQTYLSYTAYKEFASDNRPSG